MYGKTTEQAHTHKCTIPAQPMPYVTKQHLWLTQVHRSEHPEKHRCRLMNGNGEELQEQSGKRKSPSCSFARDCKRTIERDKCATGSQRSIDMETHGGPRSIDLKSRKGKNEKRYQ